MTLDELEVGKDAVIEHVGGNEISLRKHIMDMGLTPGTEVTLVKIAPMGDPLELRVRGYELTLRKADAAAVTIMDVHDAHECRNKEGRHRDIAHPGVGEMGKYHVKKRGEDIVEGEMITFALAGNQNCGKTTLFNQLTGSNQHVGNFPGVTVDRKDGAIRGLADTNITDLPGIYSLSPYTSEEIVTRDFLLKERPKGIINILDATNIERNLYLTMQLIELDIPMVLALNMMDEVRANGGTIDINGLEAVLGIPVVPVSAAKNEGIEELVQHAMHVARHRERPGRMDFCDESGDDAGAVHRCIHGIIHLIEDHARRARIPVRFAATKLVEGDAPILEALRLDENEKEKILTGKYTAIPAFLVIMGIIFWLTFAVIGEGLSRLMDMGIDWLTGLVDKGLTAYEINPVVHSLVIDGIFAGVGSVLSFLPIIVVLFFFLSILEDSGYMARIAFVTDKMLRRIGLSGRSFVPMLIGFGCSVPAIMATRTLPSDRDRRMTIMLTPFMSCSAKLPIYALFTTLFFAPAWRAPVMVGLYIIGIIVGIIFALALKKSRFKGEPVPFVMELPNYRMPGAKSVLRLIGDKAKDFITKAFTIIFIASIIIWFLQSFDTRLNTVGDSADSLLALIGNLIAPVFKPLGIGDWRISTALITGFTAKESVVSTFMVLMGGSSDAVAGLFTNFTAIIFMIFSLLYTPCVAAIAAVRDSMVCMLYRVSAGTFSRTGITSDKVLIQEAEHAFLCAAWH